MKLSPIFLFAMLSLLLLGCFEKEPFPPEIASGRAANEQSDPVDVNLVDYDARTSYDVPVVHPGATRGGLAPCDPPGSDVFILAYYFPEQATECYTESELVVALINAGQSPGSAMARAYTIFHTANNSPAYMGETAGIIGPSEVPSPTPNYTGYYWNMLDNGDCEEACIIEPQPGFEYINCPPGDITRAQNVYGKSGSVLFAANNDAWARIRYACDPPFTDLLFFDFEDIQEVLTDQEWVDLVLGNYTLREFWDLYLYQIVPEMPEPQVILGSGLIDCYTLEEVGFRTNYLAGSQFGFSVYSLNGNARFYCGPGF